MPRNSCKRGFQGKDYKIDTKMQSFVELGSWKFVGEKNSLPQNLFCGKEKESRKGQRKRNWNKSVIKGL